MTWEELRADPRLWVPDAVLALAVLLLGLVEVGVTDNIVVSHGTPEHLALALVILGTAVAVGLSRHAPAAALALVWVVCGLQLLSDTPVLLSQLTIAAVAFGTARWGSTATVVASAISIPAAGIIAVAFAGLDIFSRLINVAQYKTVLDAAYRFGDTWQVGAAVLAMSALGVPWFAGLALRFNTRATESRVSQLAAQAEAARANVESEQAREIARLREEQARLARDVHDVVGHSLAVILAQAEAAQYSPDDAAKLKETLATIATSARGSLQDVRQVLSATQAPPAPRDGGLDELIDGMRNSGHRLESTEVGSRQPLPPELDVVAYRVLQEMLTNALRHGRRDQPVTVERHWPDRSLGDADLRIEVRNMTGSPDDTGALPAGTGQGVLGMRRRLEAVGGRLDIRRRDEPDGVSFTSTAWIPVRPKVGP